MHSRTADAVIQRYTNQTLRNRRSASRQKRNLTYDRQSDLWEEPYGPALGDRRCRLGRNAQFRRSVQKAGSNALDQATASNRVRTSFA